MPLKVYGVWISRFIYPFFMSLPLCAYLPLISQYLCVSFIIIFCLLSICLSCYFSVSFNSWPTVFGCHVSFHPSRIYLCPYPSMCFSFLCVYMCLLSVLFCFPSIYLSCLLLCLFVHDLRGLDPMFHFALFVCPYLYFCSCLLSIYFDMSFIYVFCYQSIYISCYFLYLLTHFHI